MGVTEIICSFRLVLEGKTGEETNESSRSEFLKKFSANNFAYSDAEDNTSRLFNRGGVADLLLATKFLGSERLFSFISIYKFGSFRHPFATITSLSGLYFGFRRFILLVQTKKVICMNHGDEGGWYLWGIYTLIPTWTHSQNSLVAAEALSWKISSHGTSLKWSKNCTNEHENSHKLYNKTGHPVLCLMESQWKLRLKHDLNFLIEEKPLNKY